MGLFTSPGVCGGTLADDPRLPHRHGGKHRVPGAMRQQVVHDLAIDLEIAEGGRPPDDVELVIVNLAGNGLGSVFDQQPDDGEVATLHREMQRKRVVPFVADVGVCAALEQHADDRFVVDAEVQRRAQAAVAVEHRRAR